MSDDRPVIRWTTDKLAKFAQTAAVAQAKDQKQFVFDGYDFDLGYAKYLIEYLNSQFNAQKWPKN